MFIAGQCALKVKVTTATAVVSISVFLLCSLLIEYLCSSYNLTNKLNNNSALPQEQL